MIIPGPAPYKIELSACSGRLVIMDVRPCNKINYAPGHYALQARPNGHTHPRIPHSARAPG